MRYIKIPETLLPISDDILVGQNINLRIGVSIDEPTLYGYIGMVSSVTAEDTIDSNLSNNVS